MRKDKQLVRSRENKMIAGVCGGLSEYFEVDPVITRAIFIVLGFQGIGILLYIAFLILMPLPPEKVEVSTT